MAVSLSRSGSVAIVTIDNPPVNAAGHAVRQGLWDAVDTCDADTDITAIVLICAGRTFVAGADIREFGKPSVDPILPDVINKIEAAQKPWVAAIHGTALGGGLEIAMGCHVRIALATAKMGLPEVNLGLIPGAGGTVRLPRLVAAERAVDMIAGGKPIPAGQALGDGLLDAVTEGNLQAAAVLLAQQVAIRERSTGLASNLPHDASAFEATANRLRKRARGQISVGAAIDAVERALDLPAERAMDLERQTFLTLQASPQSAALRHIFFAERATLSDPRCKGEARDISRVSVVGGGTMGAGIAAACLMAGLPVNMIERDATSANTGRDRVLSILNQSAQRGILNTKALDQTQANFAVFDTYEACYDSDLIIEAVFEDMSVKQDVFYHVQNHAHPQAILATNTSYLDVNMLAAILDDPSRLIGLHFFSPAHIMKLLEIVLPDTVADDVVAAAAKLAKRLGKIGVLSGVCDGFIGNRIMSTYRREADYLIEDGALPWDVDSAMRGFGFPVGVFEMQDMAGLDIAWAMRKRRAASRPDDERYVEIPDLLCEAGRLGRKTGQGWYDYPDGKPVPSDWVTDLIQSERDRKGISQTPFSPEAIMSRIMSCMQAEAHAVVTDGIARTASDVDVVMINGYGFPRWEGGPMYMTNI